MFAGGLLIAVTAAWIWWSWTPRPLSGASPSSVVVPAATSTAAFHSATAATGHIPDGSELLHAFDGSGPNPNLVDADTRPWELQVLASSSRYLLIKIPQHTVPGTIYAVYDVKTKLVTSTLAPGPYVAQADGVTYFVTAQSVLIYRAGDTSISTIESAPSLGDNETYQRATALYTTAVVRSADRHGITLDVFAPTSTTDSDSSPPNTFLRTIHIEAPTIDVPCASQGSCFQ